MIRNRWTLAGVLGLGLFPLSWSKFPLVIPAAHAQTATMAAPQTFSPTSVIRLPIQIDAKTRAAVKELKLYVKAPGSDWMCAQTSPPSQSAFDFKAERDGEHAFMFVLVSKDGRSTPANLDARPPHQIIVVDTVKPMLNVQPLPVGNREIHLQCQVQDSHPDLASAKLEYDAGNGQWKPMELVNPTTPAVFRIPVASVLEGKVRVTARDKAGNAAQRVIDLGDPTKSLVSSNKLKEPGVMPDEIKSAAQATPAMEVRDPATLRTDFKMPSATNGYGDVKVPADANRKVDPFEVKIPDSGSKATPAGYNLNRPKPLDKPGMDPVTIPEVIPSASNGSANGNNGFVAPPDVQQTTTSKVDPYLGNIDRSLPQNRSEPAQNDTNRQSTPAQGDQHTSEMRHSAPPMGSHPIINTTRCTLDYAVENVIGGGMAKMEFWVTKDNGRNWSRVQDESGGRSPARLVMPGDGMYGVRIKANGNGQAPNMGEAPDCWVEVDTLPPTVRLLPPAVGLGNDLGTMTIQWMAHDKNMVADSITLKYSDRPDGPWMPIATNLRNEGSYRWLIPSGVGTEVYLRLEAQDRSGNLGRNELRDPVVMPQPKVKVLGIGPSR